MSDAREQLVKLLEDWIFFATEKLGQKETYRILKVRAARRVPKKKLGRHKKRPDFDKSLQSLGRTARSAIKTEYPDWGENRIDAERKARERNLKCSAPKLKNYLEIIRLFASEHNMATNFEENDEAFRIAIKAFRVALFKKYPDLAENPDLAPPPGESQQ